MILDFFSTLLGIGLIFGAGFLARAKWDRDRAMRLARREFFRFLREEAVREDEAHVRLVRTPYDQDQDIS